MANLLNLAMAAKMAGVSRKKVQQLIRDGRLHTFEGMIRVSELIRVFPETELGNTEMIEFVTRVKADAVNKVNEYSAERLLQQMVELQNQLAHEQRKNVAFAQVIVSMRDKITEMQSQCDKKDKVMLDAAMSWLAGEIEQHAIQSS